MARTWGAHTLERRSRASPLRKPSGANTPAAASPSPPAPTCFPAGRIRAAPRGPAPRESAAWRKTDPEGSLAETVPAVTFPGRRPLRHRAGPPVPPAALLVLETGASHPPCRSCHRHWRPPCRSCGPDGVLALGRCRTGQRPGDLLSPEDGFRSTPALGRRSPHASFWRQERNRRAGGADLDDSLAGKANSGNDASATVRHVFPRATGCSELALSMRRAARPPAPGSPPA